MVASRKPAGRRPSRPSPRKRRSVEREPGDVTIRLSYTEASLLVVGANMAMGLANSAEADGEHRAMAGVASDIVDKLYQAEPSLRQDAHRVEGEMRSFLADGPIADADSDDEDFDEDDEGATLDGQNWFELIGEAIGASREVALRIDDGRERRLQPLGAGHIGDVAVAIGWSEDIGDYTIVRLDEVSALRQTGITFDDSQRGLSESCLDRLDIHSPRNAN